MDLPELITRIRSGHKWKSLYHFTDTDNVDSIREHGLLSKAQLDARDLTATRPGGNNISRMLDRRNGIYNDVSLSFTDQHPMAYECRNDGRQPSQVCLRIDPAILLTEGVRLSLGIANENGANIKPINEIIDGTDIVVMCSNTDWADPDIQRRLSSVKRYEILVPKCVPTSYITGL